VTSKPASDLMGAAEIGRLLGVSRQRVQQLVNTDGFPAPVAVLDMGKVWNGSQIRDWAEGYEPRKRG
jgi:prophage regulatory protein